MRIRRVWHLPTMQVMRWELRRAETRHACRLNVSRYRDRHQDGAHITCTYNTYIHTYIHIHIHIHTYIHTYLSLQKAAHASSDQRSRICRTTTTPCCYYFYAFKISKSPMAFLQQQTHAVGKCPDQESPA